MDENDEPGHLLDHRLLRDHYGTAAMRAVFSDRASLNQWLAIEAALAQAQALCGVIPNEAAQAIQAASRSAKPDFDGLRIGFDKAGHPLIPVLKWLEQASGEAGEFVHWGATTQDILDTALAAQLKSANRLILDAADRLIAALVEQTRLHRLTVMAGRTHGQWAVPVTLGMKLALLLAEYRRHRARFILAGEACEQVQLAGAAATSAAMGEAAGAVRDKLAELLGLSVPLVPWHSNRDVLSALVFQLAGLAASCGKLCNEVVNLQRSEIGEVSEPAGSGAVGSSTMPQKANPMRAQEVVSLARLMTDQPGRMLVAGAHEHERDMAAWQMEWAIIPESFLYTHAALENTAAILTGLQVNHDRIKANLVASAGSMNAENVMMALAAEMGRETAHELMRKLVRQALAENLTLGQALKRDEACCALLGEDGIDALLAPEGYIGEAAAIVDKVLAQEG